MKKLKCAVVGAGNRGQVYCNYSLAEPDQLEIVAAVDIDSAKLKEVEKKYNVRKENLFTDLDEFVSKKISCDFVINATMDEFHYETAIRLINAGYNLLLEKPVTSSPKELLDIQNTAKEKGVEVLICHVLRYTPFYRTIKEKINSGELGDIMSIEMNEHVWIPHYTESYVRGKWRSKQLCGSSFLLAKCCHDTDLMCWLNNKTVPSKVVSLGSRAIFNEANAPKGSGEYCVDCPVEKDCLYSAKKIRLEANIFGWSPFMYKPHDEITEEDKISYLRKNIIGKCAYKIGGDITDRQTVSVLFENASICTLSMIGATPKPTDRWIHVCGTRGEIFGFLENNKFELLRFKMMDGQYGLERETVDVSGLIEDGPHKERGHGGGDYDIMRAVVKYFATGEKVASLTSIEDSINGHFIVYSADESMATGKIIDFKEFKLQNV